MDLHTVYVESYDTIGQIVSYINSHGSNHQTPKVALKDVKKIYRVSCAITSADAIIAGKLFNRMSTYIYSEQNMN